MCIRDSSQRRLKIIAEARHLPLIQELAALPHRIGAAMVHVCLLYTSDAADDLLCVDLGGCRIIKKKTYFLNISHLINHQQTHHHPLCYIFSVLYHISFAL